MRSHLNLAPLFTFLAMLCLGAPSHATTGVTLQSQQNGRYVCSGGTWLAASCDVREAIQFEMDYLADGSVAFRDLETGRYMSAGQDAQGMISVLANAIGPRERFEIQDWNVATYLRSAVAGAFVRAGIGQQTYLGAASPHMGGWEAFRVLPASDIGPVGEIELPDRIERLAGDWQIAHLALADSSMVLLEEGSRMFIMENGRFSSDLGCNMISGQFVLRGAGIGLAGAPLIQRRGCSADAHARDSIMIDALEATTHYEFDEARRLLIDRNGVPRIGLNR